MPCPQVLFAAGLLLLLTALDALAEGDTQRGAEVDRACVACHSLEPGVHLTGPGQSGA
jgi:cytochrome c